MPPLKLIPLLCTIHLTLASLPCYSSTSPPTFEDIWAVFKKKHFSGMGWEIGKYDKGIWIVEETQPKGSRWYALAVDSNGIPAVI